MIVKAFRNYEWTERKKIQETNFVLSNLNIKFITAWKVSKHGVFSGPYFPVFGPEKTPYLDTFHAVYVRFILLFFLLIDTPEFQ